MQATAIPKRAALMALGVVAAVAVPTSAFAKDPPPTGDLVFAKGTAIWRSAHRGSDKPVEIAKLPGKASAVTRLEAGKSGRFLLLEAGGTTYYVALRKGEIAQPTPLDCAKEARLSPDGICIACLDSRSSVIVYQLHTGKKRPIPGLSGEKLGFISRSALLVASGNQLRRVSLIKPSVTKVIAPHAPDRELLVAPNGLRAVASYPSEDPAGHRALYTFKLDGKAARRRLGGDAVPLRWSPDSKWILIQAQDAGCVVRAVGGQYKCWTGYQILAVGSELDEALLAKKLSETKAELFRASLAGPRPLPPTSLRTVGSPAATWIP